MTFPYLTPKQSAAAACLLDGLPGPQAAKAIGCSQHAFYRLVERMRARFGVLTTTWLVRELRQMASNRPLGNGEPTP